MLSLKKRFFLLKEEEYGNNKVLQGKNIYEWSSHGYTNYEIT